MSASCVWRRSAGPAGAWLLAGCTCVSVVRVQPGDDAPGIRYSLPRPFVVATPRADGTLEVRMEMLPDPSSTYAVDSGSFLAAHEVALKLTERGLLAEASLVLDSSAVSSAAAQAAGEAAGDYQRSRLEEAKAERERRRDEDARRRAAAEDLQRKVGESEVDLAVARAEWRVVDARRKANAGVEEKDLVAAEKRLRAAEERLAALKEQLGDLRARGLLAGVPAPPDPVERGEAFGPVFFRVVEDPATGGVRLEAAEDQKRHPTYRVVKRSAIK